MRKAPRWISKQAVLAIHGRLLAEHGGAPGLLDEGLLEAALAGPRNHYAYRRADVLRLAAAYAYAIVQNHPFTDGNKRVALTVVGVFMELNGYRLKASEQDAAQATRALASREINEPEFAAWLRASSSKVSAARRAPHRKATTSHKRSRKKK